MIDILVDEAYAIDYLAIAYVKADITPTHNNKYNYKEIRTKLKYEIGHTLLKSILRSGEYKHLVKINKELFYYIELVRKNEPILAKVLDDLNVARWKIKKQIQEKFWGSPLTETKTQIK